MKTITIKVDDKYAGVLSATFIGLNRAHTHVSNIAEYMYDMYDGMVITIDDNGKSKTEENNE